MAETHAPRQCSEQEIALVSQDMLGYAHGDKEGSRALSRWQRGLGILRGRSQGPELLRTFQGCFEVARSCRIKVGACAYRFFGKGCPFELEAKLRRRKVWFF